MRPPPGPAPAPDMAWVPRGTFAMGSEEFYPEEGPVRDVEVDGFWMDRGPVTVRRSGASCGHGPPHRRGARAGPRALPGGRAVGARAGLARLPADGRAGRPRRRVGLVVVRPPGALGPARGAGERCLHAGAAPGHPRRARRRRRLRGLGGEGPAHRGGVGARRPRRPGGRALRVGRRADARRRHPANWWQGEFPWQNLALDGWPGTSPIGASRPTASACTTCAATSGSGRPTPRPSGARGRGGRRVRVLRADGRPRAHPAPVIKGGSHLCAPSYCLRFRPGGAPVRGR